MATFTRPDGGSVSIPGSEVIRARATLGHEGVPGGTRIDWVQMSLVREPVDEVVSRVGAELPNLASVTTRGGARLWFNALKAKGPLPIISQSIADGYNSSMVLMGYRQYTVEDHAELAQIIAGAGGSPLPIP